MLFNTYSFLLLFLPITFAGYFIINRYGPRRIALYWLLAASFFFYSYWNPAYFPLLLGSLVFNYAVGFALSKGHPAHRARRRIILGAGIAGNIALLGYCKYADFFIENLNALTSSHVALLHIVLPLGISFFTFQQIAYLIDSYRRLVQEPSFPHYALFIAYFPQLIAGPIVHHAEMMPQFQEKERWRMQYSNIAAGLFMLSTGLVKKVILADSFAIWANAGFDSGAALMLVEAWVAALAYTFQLYFDFSGYSDMAIGAALLFNIDIPQNFNSPYKALSIQDFWRRWHMTLSRFMRDYIYVPLGGNRKPVRRVLVNIIAVFLIGGLWHGAGWTFVVWGLLHGAAMAIYFLWKKYTPFSLPAAAAWAFTFLFVVMGWVVFRAENLHQAGQILSGMAGLNGIILPERIQSFTLSSLHLAAMNRWMVAAILLFTLGVIVTTRNSNEHLRAFVPSRVHAFITILFLVSSLLLMHRVSEFIYFNF